MAKRFLVRNSGKSDYTQCRWKYWVGYVDRLKPNDVGGMNALIFGDIVHRAFAGWYIPEKNRKKVVRGVHPAITVDKIFDALEARQRRSKIRIVDPDDNEFEEAHELALNMVRNYIDHYGNDEEYFVVYPEMPFQLDIHDEETGEYLFTLVGTTDVLVRQRSNGAWGLLEHKTAARIETTHLVLDEQANTYWTFIPMWMWQNGIISEDVDLEFMDYNFLKKTHLDFDGPQNSDGMYVKPPTIAAMEEALEQAEVEYSRKGMKKDDFLILCEQSGIDLAEIGLPKADQPGDLFHRERVTRNAHQRQRAYERVLTQVAEMKALHDGELSLYKSPSKNCSWCQVRDLCEIDEYGSDMSTLIEYGYHHWNPFRDHIWSLKIA